MSPVRYSRNLAITAVVAVLFGLLPALPANAAVIYVNNFCSLSDAIRSANDNASVGGCTAGDSGPDYIALTQDVEVTEASVPALGEGLPAITSQIYFLGFDYSITRNSAESFRIFTLKFDGEPVTLWIYNTIISGGSTTEADQPGGGFYVGDGTAAYLDSCTVSGNSADSGGGIFAEIGGRVGIRNSLVTQNTAAQSGAGLETDWDAYIRNSTFSGNTLTDAAADTGIAINATEEGDVFVELSTFSGNSSDSASSSTLKGIAGGNPLIGVTVVDSIIANTVGGGAACAGTQPGTPDQLRNKDDDETCGGGGNLTGLDPVLADNGGPTQTHALLESSNAVDHAGDCGVLQDQRGFPRDPNLCDSGAFEFSKWQIFEDGFESGDTSAWSETAP